MDILNTNLVGHLCADPEVRTTANGDSIAKFRVACRRPKSSGQARADADFVNVACFRKAADYAGRTLRRGAQVAVQGRLKIEEYTDREGVRRTWVEVQADVVQNLDSAARPDTE